MLHATVARPDASPLFVAAFLVLWAALMGAYAHFCLRVAPAALRRWADANGHRIVEQVRAGAFDWLSVSQGSGHYVYRVVVRGPDGRERRGLIRVGTPYWFCTSAARCPVKALWFMQGDSGLMRHEHG